MCDLGSSNSASLKNVFGVTEKTYYFNHNSHKIYCFFDSPHLIKNVRNTLYGSDMVAQNEVVKWSDIEEIYNIERSQRNDCRAAPKLTSRHIFPNDFQKMKVNLAAQVLSGSVSRGMKAAVQLKQLKSDTAENTAKFVGKLNDILDALNSKSPHVGQSY